jgi:hypothetical protein
LSSFGNIQFQKISLVRVIARTQNPRSAIAPFIAKVLGYPMHGTSFFIKRTEIPALGIGLASSIKPLGE